MKSNNTADCRRNHANGARFHAVRVKGSRVEYEIIED